MYKLNVKCHNYKQYSGRIPVESSDINSVSTKRKSYKKILDKSEDSQKNANFEECEFADDAITLNEDVGLCQSGRNNKLFLYKNGNSYAIVNGIEELPCIHKCYLKKSSLNIAGGGILKNSIHTIQYVKDLSNKDHGIINANSQANMKNVYGYCTIPKRKGKFRYPKYLSKNMILPKRITPDGTHIYYWCDVHKKENVSGKLLYK